MKMCTSSRRTVGCRPGLAASMLMLLPLLAGPAQAQSGPPITPSSRKVPSELNPPFSNGKGGAPAATPAQAAAFAWQEFIALNWPAGAQTGKSGQRDTAIKILPFRRSEMHRANGLADVPQQGRDFPRHRHAAGLSGPAERLLVRL